jgi:hypothetical protein
MAALLGKAAASHWKKATFGEQLTPQQTIDWQALSLDIRRQRNQEQGISGGCTGQAAAAAAAAADASVEGASPAVATGAAGAVGTSADAVRSCNAEASAPGEEEHRGRQGISELGSLGQAGTPERKYNPDKQWLAELGSVEPANVGRTLLQEISRRSSLDSVLSLVEGTIRRQGMAQRVAQREAKGITRAVNRLLLGGVSKQVCLCHDLNSLMQVAQFICTLASLLFVMST